MIYTQRSDLQGKSLANVLESIKIEFIARGMQDFSASSVWEFLGNLIYRQSVVCQRFSPQGINSFDCSHVYTFSAYSSACGGSMPSIPLGMAEFEFCAQMNHILANMRYRCGHVVSGILYWEVTNLGEEVPSDVYKRFKQAHWLESGDFTFEGYGIRAYFTTHGSQGFGFSYYVPYKAFHTSRARLFFKYPDTTCLRPNGCEVGGSDFSVLKSRFPNAVIDVDIPSASGYESEVLFPSYTEQKFNCSPWWVWDGATEIIANGGSVV